MQKIKIIDSHVHIGKTEKTERFYTFESYSQYLQKCEVDQALVMPNISSQVTFFDLNIKFIQNFLKLTDSMKKKFFPFLLITSGEPKILEQIESSKNFIFGLKYHPSISRKTIDHPSLNSFLKFAENNKVSVLVHCGRDRKSHISYLIHAAHQFPKVTFIGAHMGGNASDLVEEALRLLNTNKTPNIYLDTSAIKLPWLIEKAVDLVGPDRIIFGSDEPYADLRVGKFVLDSANISKVVKDKIVLKNIEGRLKNEYLS